MFLNRSCGDVVNDDVGAMCLGLLHAELQTFEIDAQELPPSKQRATVLNAAQGINEKYDDWLSHNCPHGDEFDCLSQPMLIAMKHELIAATVNNHADD